MPLIHRTAQSLARGFQIQSGHAVVFIRSYGDTLTAVGMLAVVGLDARTRPPCLLHSFDVCSPGRALLAQKNKLLAHDNKPHAGCLLDLPAASSRSASVLCK